MAHKLVLFDIDGTLLRTKSKTGDIWKRLFREVFRVNISRVRREGLTETEIVNYNLRKSSIKREEIRKKLPQCFRFMEREYEKLEYRKFHGVEDLIQLLKKKGAHVCILTGNTEGRARIKLAKCDLDVHFDIGAFGNETETRTGLVPLAIRRAERKYGKRFKQGDVVVVGDTLRDIECGKHNRTKTVAVATGFTDIETLSKAGPDAVFKDFRNYNRVAKTIIKL